MLDSQQAQQQRQVTNVQSSGLSEAHDDHQEAQRDQQGAQVGQGLAEAMSPAEGRPARPPHNDDAVSVACDESTQGKSQGPLPQQTKQATCHGGHLPCASNWTQPALPSLNVPGAQSGLGTLLGKQQRRRATASDVPAARSLQQQAVRQSSGLQAARLLSWSHTADDQSLASQPSSGECKTKDTPVLPVHVGTYVPDLKQCQAPQHIAIC